MLRTHSIETESLSHKPNSTRLAGALSAGLALALLLAVFSYASWKASLDSSSLWQQLSRPSAGFFISLAGLIFCIGLAGVSDPLWIRLPWGFLALFFGWRMVISLRARRVE